jgi:hypothetical protein
MPLLLPRGLFSLPTIATALILLAASAKADIEYYRRIFFDNSLTSDAYFYSSGKASAPSSLALTNGKIPIDSKVSFTPPNALHLEWKAVQNGGWDARIDVIRFRNREVNFSGSNLFFWCYSQEGISAVALPVLRLVDTNAQFSAPLQLQAFTRDLPPQSWVQIKIPLERFSAASLQVLDSHRLQSIIFSQGTADNAAHTLIIDEIRIDGDAAAALDASLSSRSAPGSYTSTTPGNPDHLAPPSLSEGGDSSVSAAQDASASPAPQNLRAKAYERHVDLTWDPSYPIKSSVTQSTVPSMGKTSNPSASKSAASRATLTIRASLRAPRTTK